jgi:hypothetical protein
MQKMSLGLALVLAVGLSGCNSFWKGLGRPNPVPRDGGLLADEPLDRPGAEGLDAFLRGETPRGRPVYDGNTAIPPVECFDAAFGGSPDQLASPRAIPADCGPGRAGVDWDFVTPQRRVPFAWVEQVYPEITVLPRPQPREPW